VRNITTKVKLLAASGYLARRPVAADSQETAATNARRRPETPSQASGRAAGRNPMRRATVKTRTVEAVLRTMLAATCPARTAGAPTSMDQNRSMMPPVMSWLTVTAVVAEPKPAHNRITPGTT